MDKLGERFGALADAESVQKVASKVASNRNPEAVSEKPAVATALRQEG